ncbi:MAG: ABC transporter permease subunit [Alphaproteobacteria bacterium]|nr:ABC transporter permease subunit [Alphaproteobacteria bacterium]
MSVSVLETLLLSLKIAGAAMLWAIPLGYWLGYILARRRFALHWLLSALTTVPLVMPPVATGLILLYVLGPMGPVGWLLATLFDFSFAFAWTGAAVAAGIVALPLIVRPVRLSLEGVDPKLDEALAVAGHGPWRRFMMLYLPLSMPGVVAGGVLGFAKGLGEFGATITFVANIPGETQTLSLAIHSASQRIDGGGEVLVLGLVAVGLSVAAVAVSEWVLAAMSRRLSGQDGRHA